MQDVMNPEHLPPALRDLEELLARRPGPEPAADYRARILSGMAQHAPARPSAATGRRSPWLWRTAAALVLALNLAMSVGNSARFRRLETVVAAVDQPARPWPPVAAVLDTEDRFAALAATALAHLNLAPHAGALGRQLFTAKEEHEWDLH
jgi:hypothetical protein